jgi:pimeloyl-ACP methyl ester carboxylesterase
VAPHRETRSTTTTADAAAVQRSPVQQQEPPAVPRSGLTALVVAVGGSVVVMVGRDGSAAWQVVRVVIVVAVTVAAVVAVRRLDDRGRGWVSAGLGAGAVALGIGFSPWLGKATASAEALAALVAVVGGLALVVAGTVVRTRGRRRLRRAGAGLATLVAVALAVLVVAPAVAATNVPPTDIGATPESIDLAYEDVTLTTDDDVRLAGWYVPSSNGAAVVLRHGAGSTRSDVLAEAAVLARHGFGVLMVDARGHGDSGGRAMDLGWHGDADIAAATSFLVERDDVDTDRIAVVGSSMGGEEAIGASGADESIRAVVAEGATARTAADKAWMSDAYGWRGAFQELLERLQFALTDALTSASSPTALRTAVGRSGDTQYLLVTAGAVADEAAAAFIATGAPDRVQTWDVEGASHTDGLAVAPEEWETRVVSFLASALDVRTD